MEFAFILKKIISAMVMPLSIGLFLAIIGLILLYINRIKSAKILLTISILWIALISYSPFANSLIKPIATTYKKLEEIPKDVKYILLVGGDMENRAWEVLKLYYKIPNAKIITSGYKSGYAIPEAVRTANILYQIQIPKEDIIIHSNPKDTKEEAIEIKQLLGEKPFILVTAAHHMPRAMALFQKEGLHPIAAPANYNSYSNIDIFSIPNGGNLQKTEIAWHEYLGILWGKLRGQID
ncbi:MAG: YdcF family protein [Arcobacteraceae bacterium]|nr:YdcF family protein [Arcobacteraceae bacterium]